MVVANYHHIQAVLFLHIGWALRYEGHPNDLPQGRFGYIEEGNKDLGESYNFKAYNGFCYGYAPHGVMHLERLGGTRDTKSIDNILVVWTATNPDGTGRFIIGWYKNATVFSEYRDLRPTKRCPFIIARARASDCHLVAKDDRAFSIPYQKKGWPGTSSAFFASEKLSKTQIGHVISYVNGKRSIGFLAEVARPNPRAGKGWPKKPDLVLMKKVEKAAEAVVVAHYKKRGWSVREVQDEWYGWDMTMTQGARELYVEIKGRNSVGPIQLSSNEYRKMIDERIRMKYRLAIVLDALSVPKLTIFSYQPASNRLLKNTKAVCPRGR